MRVIIVLCILLAIGCSEMQMKQEVDQSRLQEWADDLEYRINIGDSSALSHAFQAEAFTDRIFFSGEEGVAEKVGNLAVRQSVGHMMGMVLDQLTIQLHQELQYGGGYELLRTYERDGEQHAIFRLFGQGLNYHDFTLKTGRDGVKAIDVYMATSGESLSETLRNMLYATGVMGDEVVDMDMTEMQSIEETKLHMSMRDGHSAKASFDRMPERFKNTKVGGLLEVQIAGLISDSLYHETLDAYLDQYPGDESGLLLGIDAHFLSQQYEDAIELVDRLDDRMQDPLLERYRANCFVGMEQYAKAVSALERMEQRGMEYDLDSHFILLDALIGDEQYAASVGLIDEMVELYDMDPDMYFDFTDFPAFTESEVYRTWKAS